MTTILLPPTQQEIDTNADLQARFILKVNSPDIVKSIAQYGQLLALNVRAPQVAQRDFYYNFVRATRPGYSEFITRFNGDNDKIAAFEDAIARRVYQLTRG